MSTSYDYKADYVSVSTESGRSPARAAPRGCCHHDSILVKGLTGLLTLAMLVILALIALLIYNQYGREYASYPVGDKICNSKDCVLAASHILKAMNTSADPCTNMYQYACGGWTARQLIPDHRSDYTTFSELSMAIDIQLKNLLEESPTPGEHASVQSARNLYQSCKDDELLTSRGDGHFKAWLLDEFGGWPLLMEDWDESTFDLTAMVAKAARLNSFALAALGAHVDPKNSSRHILMMDHSSLGMPGRKYYLVARNDTMLQAYQTFIGELAAMLGAPDSAAAAADVEDLVDFEIEMAKIQVPSEDRRDNNALYNLQTVSEVHQNYSSELGLDFRRLIQLLAASPAVGVTDIRDGEPVINRSPPFYERLSDLLEKTPRRTLANYVVARLALPMANYLTPAYRALQSEYRKALLGAGAEQRRDVACSGLAASVMDLAVGRGFVTKYFDHAAKQEALAMIGHLQAAFAGLIDATTWMDDVTKTVAKEKNANIRSRIGYPEYIFNDTKLEENYINMTFFADKYFENGIRFKTVSYENRMRMLRKPTDKEAWLSEPFVVNAYYSPSRNEIMFPGGILQPPFFHKNYPKALNYGAIGSIIGHEITHGFDDRGRQYDKDGNLKQWWDDVSDKRFRQQAKCLIHQYGNFTEKQVSLKLNGVQTQGENIADNGGVKASFKGYRHWVASQGGEEERLPGVDLTSNQLFFVSFAQVWCSKHRDEGLIKRIRTGVHSPGQFRVLGTIQNSEDFSRAFNCPAGTRMNPVKKCSVW